MATEDAGYEPVGSKDWVGKRWQEGSIYYMRLANGTVVHRHRKGMDPDQDAEEARMGGMVFSPPGAGEEPRNPNGWRRPAAIGLASSQGDECADCGRKPHFYMVYDERSRLPG